MFKQASAGIVESLPNSPLALERYVVADLTRSHPLSALRAMHVVRVQGAIFHIGTLALHPFPHMIAEPVEKACIFALAGRVRDVWHVIFRYCDVNVQKASLRNMDSGMSVLMSGGIYNQFLLSLTKSGDQLFVASDSHAQCKSLMTYIHRNKLSSILLLL